MKTILRHRRTGLYFQGGASWTRDTEDAWAYPDIECALEAAHCSAIADLELNLLLFDDPRYTVRVALDDVFHRAKSERARRAALGPLSPIKVRIQSDSPDLSKVHGI